MQAACRHHFGITAFGVNAWTGHAAGDRIINEHDEANEDEELNLVLSGGAVFELEGERRDAPTAGRPADAVEHLRHAIEVSAEFRGLAKSDSDFDPIRDESAFKDLVGGDD